jgi:hypothetical protein
LNVALYILGGGCILARRGHHPRQASRADPVSEPQRLRDRVEELLGMGEDDVSLIRQLTGMRKTKAEMVGVLRKSRGVLTKEALLALGKSRSYNLIAANVAC